MQRIRNGEEGAVNILLRKYFSHCRRMALQYCDQFSSHYFSYEDFYSIACESLNDAITRFDLTRDNFYAYWKVVAENNIKNYIKTNFKKMIQTGYSFDFSYRDGSCLHDIFGKEDSNERGDMLIETFEKIIDDLKYSFTELEKSIIKCTLSGFGIREICEILHKSRSTIYRHYNIAVAKIRRVMNNNK